jgi:hypothetical protein
MGQQTQDQMLLCSNELFVGVSFLISSWGPIRIGKVRKFAHVAWRPKKNGGGSPTISHRGTAKVRVAGDAGLAGRLSPPTRPGNGPCVRYRAGT